jgi:hypothetical protein
MDSTAKRDALLTIGGVIALIIGLWVLVTAVGAYSCGQRWQDVPHQYVLFGGCLVQDADGRWIPSDNWRVIE